MYIPKPERTSCAWWQKHKFSLWEDILNTTTVAPHNRPVLIQERICMCCGKKERNTIYS